MIVSIERTAMKANLLFVVGLLDSGGISTTNDLP